jgi:hypothetical protein
MKDLEPGALLEIEREQKSQILRRVRPAALGEASLRMTAVRG